MFLKDKFYDLQVFLHKKFAKNKKQKNMSAKKRSERIFLTLLFAYPVIQFFIFYICVNINSILLAFKEFNSETRLYDWAGFKNFKQLFFDFSQDSQMLGSLKRGVILYLCELAIGMPLHILIAYLLYKKIPGSDFFRTVLFIPSLICTVAMVLMFQYFVELGIPTVARELFGVKLPALFRKTDTAFPLLIFYGIWSGMASGMVIYMSAMSRIPETLIEYGRMEGISLFKEFMSVILPLIYPTITMFIVTGLAGLFTSSGAMYLFYEDDAMESIQTLGYYLFTRVIGENASFEAYPYASAVGLAITAVTAPIVFGAKWVFERFDPSVEF